MTFDWLRSRVPPAFRASVADRALDAQRREVRDRAGILMRLGWTQGAVERRCRATIAWELDLGPASDVQGEIKKLVAEVFKRR